MPPTNCEIIIIVEAQADFRTATAIARKTLLNFSPEWLRGNLENPAICPFIWSGLTPNTQFSCWADIKEIIEHYKGSGARFLGFKNNFGWDYASGRKVLLLIAYLTQKYSRTIPAVLFIRDADSQETPRSAAFEQLREDGTGMHISVIIGLAKPKREAWILNSFSPQNPQEKQTLDKLINDLKLNPCDDAHKLRGKVNQPGTESRDIKRVLASLIGDDLAREEDCLEASSMDYLMTKGCNTGLRDYILDVHTILIPVLEKRSVDQNCNGDQVKFQA